MTSGCPSRWRCLDGDGSTEGGTRVERRVSRRSCSRSRGRVRCRRRWCGAPTSFSRAPRARPTARSRGASAPPTRRWASGAGASSPAASRACTTSCARASRARSTTSASRSCSTRRCTPSPRMAPPIGACAGWPPKPASPRPACIASCRRSGSSPIAATASSSPPIRSSSRSCATSSGCILNPPDKALVLCVDEKSQIQALERTQPMLPLGFGYVEGVTHDYLRHGTTTLFAALNVLDGAVLAQCKPAASAPGVPRLPARDRPGRAGRARHPPHRRQLRHPQASQGQGLARRAAALAPPLHPDLQLLAQSGRALLRPHHRQGHPARLVPLGHATSSPRSITS